MVMGLGMHQNKRQLHRDIPMEGEKPHAARVIESEEIPAISTLYLLPPSYSPTTRYHQLHLDPVGHQDSQHLLVGTLLHTANRKGGVGTRVSNPEPGLPLGLPFGFGAELLRSPEAEIMEEGLAVFWGSPPPSVPTKKLRSFLPNRPTMSCCPSVF